MAAAPTGGYASPPQFDETSDKWPAYQVRLEAFFEGNGITEDNKKRALLVTALSTHTVDVLSGRCAPDKPGEPVWVRNFGRGEPWTPASITSTDGARLVNADGPEGETIRRHSDQVKPRELEHDQGEA
ncbi:hypothetical protein MTO96_038763, partial [Rhipicephalus appendiculatus]